MVPKHIKKKIMLGYAGSAVRKAVASQQNQVGETARSGIGALAENLPKFYNLSKMPTPKYKIGLRASTG